MYLTRPQRNLIYEAIAGAGLDPAQCDLKATDEGFRIIHSTGSTFIAVLITEGLTDRIAAKLSLNKRRFNLAAHVEDGSYSIRQVRIGLDNFMDGFLPTIADWAADVKRITETPDRWANMKRSQVLFTDIRDSHGQGNTLFTEDEQHQIAAQLQGIRKSLTDRFELSGEQVERIAEKLDEAEEASRRMGRKDWLLLFSGTIFSVIITDIVTPSVAEHIFTMVVHGIGHLFTSGSEPPQIPPRIIA